MHSWNYCSRLIISIIFVYFNHDYNFGSIKWQWKQREHVLTHTNKILPVKLF